MLGEGDGNGGEILTITLVDHLASAPVPVHDFDFVHFPIAKVDRVVSGEVNGQSCGFHYLTGECATITAIHPGCSYSGIFSRLRPVHHTVDQNVQ